MDLSLLHQFVQPVVDVAANPAFLIPAGFVAVTAAATALKASKNATAQRVGSLLDIGRGIAYKYLAVAAATNQPVALSAAAIAALEKAAIDSGVQAIKDAAASDAKALPSDAELALRVTSAVSALPGYHAVLSSLATAQPPAPSAPTSAA